MLLSSVLELPEQASAFILFLGGVPMLGVVLYPFIYLAWASRNPVDEEYGLTPMLLSPAIYFPAWVIAGMIAGAVMASRIPA